MAGKGGPFAATAWVLCLAILLVGGASSTSAEERSAEEIFALDEIAESGLEIVLYQDLIILSLDDRVEYDVKEQVPFLGMSMWVFLEDGSFVQFCVPGRCQLPLHFDYRILEDGICLTEEWEEITSCYTLESRDGQIDWVDEAGTRVATSFTAFRFDGGVSEDELFAPMDQEMALRFQSGRGGELIDGLTALGLLEPDAGEQFDVRVRSAIVELQRRNGIFPSGFVGEGTLRVIEGRDPLGPELEERGPGSLACFHAPSSACLLDLGREMLDAVEWRG